jgi:hypothetical protein
MALSFCRPSLFRDKAGISLKEDEMELRVDRYRKCEKSTLGRMFVDGAEECYTLEDVRRPDGVKVQDATCIPPGTYTVVIDASVRFKRDMPHVLDVPNFTGIRIHSGNTDADTDGCILLGSQVADDDLITGSKDAFDAFFAKLKAAIDKGDAVSLVIHEDFS